MEEALQYETTTQCTGLPPAGSGDHHLDRPKADHALTITLDPSNRAAHRDYLAKNLQAIEQGLKIFDDGNVEGIEYRVGGRYIDILAVDSNESFVVIELKVSRGYDRVIGQLLRYMAWVINHLSNGRVVRGIIVASEITDDLRMAASLVSNVSLIEYEIEFRLNKISDEN